MREIQSRSLLVYIGGIVLAALGLPQGGAQ